MVVMSLDLFLHFCISVLQVIEYMKSATVSCMHTSVCRHSSCHHSLAYFPTVHCGHIVSCVPVSVIRCPYGHMDNQQAYWLHGVTACSPDSVWCPCCLTICGKHNGLISNSETLELLWLLYVGPSLCRIWLVPWNWRNCMCIRTSRSKGLWVS